MQPLRIYLIGAGVVAHTHAAAIQTLPEGQEVLLTIADPNAHARDMFLRAYPHARAFDNAQTMLAEPACESDLVIVAAPPFLHCELTCAALQTGRHVLCEKPFAMNNTEAMQMLQTARAYKRFLGCCSSRSLGSPTEYELRRLVQENVLGTIYHLRFVDCTSRYRAGIEMQPESRWFLKQEHGGGGVLMNLGPYDIAFINAVLQPLCVDVLAAWMTNPLAAPEFAADVLPDVEQHIGATLRYHLPDGSKVAVSYERAACSYGEPQETLELIGLQGAARWDWFLWQQHGRLVHSFEQDGKHAKKVTLFENNGDVETMLKPLYYFYHHLCGMPSSALINEHAVFNFACLQAIYACARTGEAQEVALQDFL